MNIDYFMMRFHAYLQWLVNYSCPSFQENVHRWRMFQSTKMEEKKKKNLPILQLSQKSQRFFSFPSFPLIPYIILASFYLEGISNRFYFQWIPFQAKSVTLKDDSSFFFSIFSFANWWYNSSAKKTFARDSWW